MDKWDFVTKFHRMIEKSIIKNLKLFEKWKNEHSNQPVRLCGTAKTDKLEHPGDVTRENIIRSNWHIYLQCCLSDSKSFETTMQKWVYNEWHSGFLSKTFNFATFGRR